MPTTAPRVLLQQSLPAATLPAAAVDPKAKEAGLHPDMAGASRGAGGPKRGAGMLDAS